jgi:hypothetical protein
MKMFMKDNGLMENQKEKEKYSIQVATTYRDNFMKDILVE